MQFLQTISRRVRRGVSLVELLIAIGVVLAIAAIVIPWTAGWLGGRELDNAEDNLTMQMMMARAAAREEGRPVQVVVQNEGGLSRVKACWLSGGDGAEDGFQRSGRRDESASSSINAPWATMQLPHGVRVALGLESASSDVSDGVSAPSLGDEGDEAGAARGQTLAIFLPDGTVFFAPVFMLRTDAGSLRAMKVDHATGVPQAVEHAPIPADGDDVERPEFEDPEFPAPDFDDLGSGTAGLETGSPAPARP